MHNNNKKKESWINLKIFKKNLGKEKFLHLKGSLFVLVYFV